MGTIDRAVASPGARAEASVLARAIAHLEAAGLNVSTEDAGSVDKTADAHLSISVDGRQIRYRVQIRHRVSAESALALSPSPGARPLMVVPRVSEAVAEVWRANDVHFVDGAGNAYLRQPGVLLDVRGRRQAPSGEKPGSPPRWSRPAGLMIVFALMCESELVLAPFREIAEASGASLGSVQGAVADLERDGFVLLRRGRRTLERTRELLDSWVAAFTLELYPRLLLGRFEATTANWWQSADAGLDREHAVWGGETAACVLGLDLKPSRVLAYAPELPRSLILEHRLRKATDDGSVEFRRRFWEFATPGSRLAPSPLVYADLIASGDPRLAEAARQLRETDDLLRRLDRS
jgi:hypothetical protein